jgi:DNA invertase Pin-like site-specific DNA recombinase
MLHIDAALAEKERALIAGRTRAALAQMKDAAANPTAADAFADNVLAIVRQIEAGAAAMHWAIASALNARRVRTARGGARHGSTARNLWCERRQRMPWRRDDRRPPG